MRLVEKMAMAVVGAALAMLLGCESGTEVTGVDSAVATKQANGSVSLNVKTACFVAEGMGRLDDSCDSDGDRECFHADWIAHVNPGPKVMTTRLCKEIDHVRSRGFVTLTSPAAVPTDQAYDIYVYSDDMAGNPPVIIASP
jgi:hypothetical protein